jgi:hypothetical protein
MRHPNRMLAWSSPGNTGMIYVVDDLIRATITQSGRMSDGTKRFRFSSAIDGDAYQSVPQADLEEAKEDAEEGVYLRAKALIPRLTEYVVEYEQRRPGRKLCKARPIPKEVKR